MCVVAQIMVDNSDFTPSQVGGLFTFLARQLAKPDNTLFVNRNLFDQVSRRRPLSWHSTHGGHDEVATVAPLLNVLVLLSGPGVPVLP